MLHFFHILLGIAMVVTELLNPSLIQPELKGRTKTAVIEELLDLLIRAGKIKDKTLALKDCVIRENYLSTGFENGLAVPHAKTEAVSELLLAFGVSRSGIEFDSLDGKPAHFIFLLLSPVNESGPHIKILAQITRQFQDTTIAAKILAATSVEDILNVFQSIND
jgi:fructose-specific phosphotransferase system IIA component